MKMRKILSLALVLALCLSLVPAALAVDGPTSGYCGPEGNESSVAWSVETNGKTVEVNGTQQDAYTLTISGSGPMQDFNHDVMGAGAWAALVPWMDFQDNITDVVVSDGITKIGDEAFGSIWTMYNMPNMSNVTIGNTVTELGICSFSFAKGLKSITLPDSVVTISPNAFYGAGLASFEIGKNVQNFTGGGLYDVPHITLAEENPYFTFVDDVLYDKNVTKMVFYPSAMRKDHTSFNIPETVTGEFQIGSRFWGTNLQNVTCPETVTLGFEYDPPEGDDWYGQLPAFAHIYTKNTANIGNADEEKYWETSFGAVVHYEILPYTLPVQDVRFADGYGFNFPDTPIYVGDKKTNLATNYTPGGGAITYSSSDPSIAAVDPVTGEVTYKRAGAVLITATAAPVDGQWMETKVSYILELSSLQGDPIPEQPTLTLDKSNVSVKVGKTATVTATVTGYGGKSVYAISDDASVASVSVSDKKITVKGEAEGETSVYVIMSDTTNVSLDAAKADPSMQEVRVTVTKATSGGGSSNPGGNGGGRPSGGSSVGGGSNPVTPTQPEDKPRETRPASQLFTDVEKDSWYEAGVSYVVENKLFLGTGDDTFAPMMTMTRGMLMTVLARSAGADTTVGKTWYEAGMNWAKVNGVSDGTNPEAVVTREQIVTMLWRYMGQPTPVGDIAMFADGLTVSDWADLACSWAVGAGILTGKDGNRLDPQGQATRAEVAVLLERLWNDKK